ncbi:DUF3427 domain-containing protein [Macrococcoides canis]|uniref:DUF3427 domain-containing protein n=1 Tax=Macrococcoides canis TaxID=1855823 RepID=UPI00105E8D19|nr:DUF3427 domain-containing protein [Macrococcus canis]TDM29817.1 DUF3427 domain-containing protein [Macrococcus canis]
MKKLRLGELYNREDVSKIFNSHSKYTRGSGVWGLHGIIPLKEREGDYIFFVTLKNNEHQGKFDEGISIEGILSWHSQLKKDINHKYTQHFINHNPLINNIHLFYREDKNGYYIYFGRLGYLEHDSSSLPIFFKWQLLDWNQFNKNDLLSIVKNYTIANEGPFFQETNTIIKTDPPNKKSTNLSEKVNDFKPYKIDFIEINNKNKDIGDAGEKLVIKYLYEVLWNKGEKKLAESIFHTAKYEGDGAGYDIKAKDEFGKDIYIEVKTSTGGINSDFFISSNEIEFSKLKNESYYLFRIYEYDVINNTGKFYIVNGDLEKKLLLKPINFKAKYMI